MSEENGTSPGTPGEQKSELTDKQLAEKSLDKAEKQNKIISTSYVPADDVIILDEGKYEDGDNHFLVTLNRAITALIKRDKVINEADIDIWYDLPENDDKTPDGPTICIYLYDIKENSSMRNGESGSRGYTRNSSNNLVLYHGYLHIQCSYLIIFWDKTSQHNIANNQNAIIASRIVTALLDTYHLDKIPEFNHFPDYDARFIQSSEQMNSISNFWQSLKQRPRLCLSYEVTVPILIPEQTGAKAPIQVTTQELGIFASQDKPVNPNVDKKILKVKQATDGLTDDELVLAENTGKSTPTYTVDIPPKP